MIQVEKDLGHGERISVFAVAGEVVSGYRKPSLVGCWLAELTATQCSDAHYLGRILKGGVDGFREDKCVVG